MGYKRAGFEVVGNVEIDPAMNDLYITNNKPRLNYCEDLRDFNRRDDLPEELMGIDILDGSPPCTSFSIAGVRERDWGKVKKFREGQKVQTLDDLFFVFLDTVEKLNPKIVVAENVAGIIAGSAKGYVNLVVKRFNELGYDLQVFKLNAAYMDVPQARERVFFIANRMGYPKLKLDFKSPVLKFGEVKSEKGKKITSKRELELLKRAKPGEKNFSHVMKRVTGESNKFFSDMTVFDAQVCPTVTSGGSYYRADDLMKFSEDDFRRVQTFPADYNFKGRGARYVCGMSVPPNMMANIAMEIWKQWLSKK